MTETTRHPVHRDDGELVGFVTAESSGWAARTAFGVALAQTTDREDAETYLTSHGLSYLADRWEWHDGSDWMRVDLVEVSPSEVSLMLSDFGHPDRYGERHTLRAPVTEGLRRV